MTLTGVFFPANHAKYSKSGFLSVNLTLAAVFSRSERDSLGSAIGFGFRDLHGPVDEKRLAADGAERPHWRINAAGFLQRLGRSFFCIERASWPLSSPQMAGTASIFERGLEIN